MFILKNIITEITLDTAQPYATQFAWTRAGFGHNSWRTSFQADGQTIDIQLIGYNVRRYEGFTYDLEFRVPSQWGTATTHTHSSANAQLNYFRLMNTIWEAIMDFINQHSPAAIDVSGSDHYQERAAQKTRIYAALLRSNSTRLAQAGYRVIQTDRKLEIVRDDVSDASGIDTPGNPNM